MLTLNRQTDYALQFIAALTRLEAGEMLSLRQFATNSSISFAFMQRIVRSLKASKIVRSTQGSGGGYALAKNADKITVQDIVESIEGPVAVTMCISDPGACVFETKCTSKKTISEINFQISELLREVKVSEL